VLIRDSGLVLTIGYLITEAESIWLSPGTGHAVPGHALAYDQETGFGLVQPLRGSICRRCRSAIPAMRSPAIAWSWPASADASVRWRHASWPSRNSPAIGIRAGRGDLHGTSAPQLGWHRDDRSIGELLGIGSLKLEQGLENQPEQRRGVTSGHLNMIVPIDLLKPILDDLLHHGRPNRPPRPCSASTRPRSTIGSW